MLLPTVPAAPQGEHASELPGWLTKAEPGRGGCFSVSDSGGLWWRLRMCFSDNFLSDAHATGSGSHLDKHCPNLSI